MKKHHHTHITRGAIFATAILIGGIATSFAGTATAGKGVIEKAEVNPLSFYDGKLVFDVQERLRLEIRDNNFDFSDVNTPTDDTWLLQRFRLGILIKPVPWLKFYVQGQDSREIDSERPEIPGSLGAEGDDWFDLRQAYVEIGDPKEFPLVAKIGRQVLQFGDERLIGAFEWNNFARTFDAAKLTWKEKDWQLDAFVSSPVVIQRDQINLSDGFNGNENDRELIFSGLYFTTSALPFGTADACALWLSESNGTGANVAGGVTPTQPKGPGPLAQHSSFGTYGARLKGDPKKLHGFEFEFEGVYQNGEVRDQALNAWAAHGGVGYNFDTAWKPRLWAEYNYGSGDGDPTDNDSETFQNLFPTNHKFYGFMDVFSWQNVHDAELSLRVAPLKTVTVQLDYHAFWLASTDDVWYRANGLTAVRPLTPAARAASNFAGHELDFTVTWNVNKHLQVQGGYSHFFAGGYLSDTGPSDDANFGYLQATLTF